MLDAPRVGRHGHPALAGGRADARPPPRRAFTPQQAAAAAPAFAPAFGALPSSFLKGAAGPAPGLRAFDPDLLLGSAFPGLRAGSPAYLGYDPASAVTTASQVQALPVDALTRVVSGCRRSSRSWRSPASRRSRCAGSSSAARVHRRRPWVAPPPRPMADAELTDDVTAEGGRGPRRGRRRGQAEVDEAAGTGRSPARTPVPPEVAGTAGTAGLRRTW